jgi:hypothetical protein
MRAGTGLPITIVSASLALLGVLLLAGCGKSSRLTSVSPNVISDRAAATGTASARPTLSLDGADSRGHGFYPLQIGNRWAYRSVIKFILTDASGPHPPDVVNSRIERELTGTTKLFGRTYVIEEARYFTEGSPSPNTSATFFRQDPAGLYEADVPPPNPGAVAGRTSEELSALDAHGRDYIARTVANPEHRAAFETAWAQLSSRLDLALHIRASAPATATDSRRGGVLDHEITRLRYPLFPGQQWTIRPSPFFGSLVEAHETVALPAGRFPGYRIRISSEFFGPNDAVKFWYGRAGLLRDRVHVESVATDENGNPIGTAIVEQEDELVRLDIVHPGRHSKHRIADPDAGLSASQAK